MSYEKEISTFIPLYSVIVTATTTHSVVGNLTAMCDWLTRSNEGCVLNLRVQRRSLQLYTASPKRESNASMNIRKWAILADDHQKRDHWKLLHLKRLP